MVVCSDISPGTEGHRRCHLLQFSDVEHGPVTVVSAVSTLCH